MTELDLFAEEHLANPLVSLDSEKDCLTRAATSCSPILPLLQNIGPVGWCGRTSPASFRPGAMTRVQRRTLQEDKEGNTWWNSDTISHASLEGLNNSGMGGPTESLTLNTSEWTGTSVPYLKEGGVFSLSDILEHGNLPQRYYLSKRACRGILRRAERRGKELPGQLRAALENVATQTPVTETGED